MLLRLLGQHWFIVGYVVVLAVAMTLPDLGRSHGFLHLDSVTQKLCIAGVFLCSGLSLPSARLGQAFRAWKPHVAIQCTTFIVAPALACGLAWIAMPLGLPSAAATGLIVLGCLPTTIGTCVAVTTQANGNEGITLINSVLSNVLGVVVTPFLIVLCIGREGSTPVLDVVQLLILIAVVPALVGQLIRLRWATTLDAHKKRISVISGCLLLVVVLTIFSDLAQRGFASGILPIVLTVGVLHLLLWLSIWVIAPLASRERGDRVAMMITANQKTAALGIPLISTLFTADPLLPLMILPVALYHMLQMLSGAFMASVFKPWVAQATPLPPPPAR